MSDTIKNPSKLPGILALILALLLVLGFVVPHMSLTGEYRDQADVAGLLPLEEELGINASDLKDLSFLKYDLWFLRAGAITTNDMAIMSLILGGLSLLILLFAAVRRATPLIIFSLIFISAYKFTTESYMTRVGSDGPYDWAIGHTLWQVCPFLLVAVGVWLFVTKIIYKTRVRNAQRG